MMFPLHFKMPQKTVIDTESERDKQKGSDVINMLEQHPGIWLSL